MRKLHCVQFFPEMKLKFVASQIVEFFKRQSCVNAQRPGDVIITLVAKQFLVESSPFSESLGQKILCRDCT